MIRAKTVFVVGAGASVEAGFPSGDGLRDIIGKLTEPAKEDWTRTANLNRAINAYLASPDHAPETTVKAELNRLSRAIYLAPSIDNYLHSNRENSAAVMMGKLAIAHAISDSEQNCHMVTGSLNGINTPELRNTWYARLSELLVEGITPENLPNIFDNVGFVVFNYDRCIEHFLFHMLRLVFGISAYDARELVNRIPIVHPYGSLGRLPWQDGEAETFDFGQSADGPSTYRMAQNIRTFTEEQGDEAIQKKVRKLMAEARLMAFVGFGFIDLNMSLLKPETACQASCIAGTCFQVSDDNRSHIQQSIATRFQSNNIVSAVKLAHPLVKANQFFSDYAMTLRSNY